MLDTLLSTISPDKFAAAYGVVRSVDGSILCDFEGLGTYRAHAGGFVYVGTQSTTMPTANIVDIKAMLRRATDSTSSWSSVYRESVGAIVKKFSAIVPANFKGDRVVDLIGDEALKRRRLNNIFTTRPTDPASLPGPMSILLARRFNASGLNDYFVYVSRKDMHDLAARCSAITGKKLKLRSADALVAPYFSSVSNVVALVFYYANKTSATVWLGKERIGYAAIHKLFDTSSVLEGTLEEAVRDQYAGVAAGASYTVALINPSGSAKAWVPKSALYVARTPNVESLIHPASISKLGCSVMITTTPFLGVTDWSMKLDYAVTGAIVEDLRKAGYVAPGVLALMNALSSADSVRESVSKELEELSEHRLRESFRSATRGGAIWATTSGKMYATDAGYLWEDDSNADMNGELVTNFLITPELSMSYETGELYRRMKVSIGDAERVVDLPSGALDTPKKLTETINDVISLSGKPTAVSAAVYDQTRARAVVLWATKQFSVLPVYKGTSYIGWSPTSTKYVTPTFTLQKVGDDVIETPGVWLRPGVDYFKYFLGDMAEAKPSFDLQPGEVTNLVYQVAAIILRTYSRHPVSPIEYSGTKETRDAIATMFKSVAQTGLLQLNKNMRAASQLDALYGWPYAAQGYNRSQAKACENTMILLGEEGPTIHGSEYELANAADLIAWIVREVPKYLMKNSGPAFLLSADKIDSVVTAAEGRHILKEILDSMGVNSSLPEITYETNAVVL